MAPSTQLQEQKQQKQQPPPEAFIYRRGAASGGLRSFPQQLWQPRKRLPQAAVAAPSATAASLGASNPTPLTAFDAPGFISCPEAFLESDALISRIASKIAERFPKVAEEENEKDKEKERAREKEKTRAKQVEEVAAAAAAAPAAAPKKPLRRPSAPSPPSSANKAAASKHKKLQQMPLSSLEQQHQQTSQTKTKTKAKAKTGGALDSGLRAAPLSLGDFAAAEAALASGLFAAKKRSKKAEAATGGSSAEA